LSKQLRPRFRGWVLPSACLVTVVLTVAGLSGGCTAAHTVAPRHTGDLRDGWITPVAWFTPVVRAEERVLSRWRRGVGPPVLQHDLSAIATPADEITVVSWNIANGAGDVAALIATLPADRPLVLLLQEAFRGGPEVPSDLDARTSFAARLGGLRADADALDVEALAAALDLNVYYVPSMRNGGATSDEDRGNAILSNQPLSDLMAVELPFERQRRVAVVATVTGVTTAGSPWAVRVASAHLDNLASAKYAWLGGEFARARQARALREAIAWDGPTVLGCDFNTWFGFTEPAYLETALAFPDARVTDRRPTFAGLLRLDHLFFRLDEGWSAEFGRGAERFGSDHFPLVGTVRLR
jgi:endonuclease/exonuclease/phosphatase family metal-dependent hydrolase